MVSKKEEYDMVWNTYRANFNSRRIEIYNVFNHYSFYESVKKIIQKRLSKEDLSVALRREVRYYFWSRCEYEVTIAPFPAYIDDARLEKMIDQRDDFYDDYGQYPCVSTVHLDSAMKVDIADQVLLNWDAFVDYVYKQYKPRVKKENKNAPLE